MIVMYCDSTSMPLFGSNMIDKSQAHVLRRQAKDSLSIATELG